MNFYAAFPEQKYAHIFLVCFRVLLEECFHGVFGRLGDLCRAAFWLDLGLVGRSIFEEIVFYMIYGRTIAANFPTDVFGAPFVEEESDNS